MKKSSFSAFAFFAAVAIAGTTILSSCGNKNNNEENTPTPQVPVNGNNAAANTGTDVQVTEIAASNIEVPDTAKQEQKHFESNLNIRFVDIEAIMKDYEYAKLERANFEAKDKAIQKEQADLQQQDYNKQSAINQKVQNNQYQSEDEFNKDMQAYQQWAQTESEKLGKKLQAIQDQYNATNEKLNKAIENYITRYNNDKKYDAILLKGAGLYFNPSLDITKEILQGLNAEYKK